MDLVEDDVEGPSDGQLVRVRLVDLDANRVYYDRVEDGHGWLWHPAMADATPGSVYFVPSQLEHEVPAQLAPSAWPKQSNSIATVIELSDDGASAIVEIGGKLARWPQRLESPFAAGQTIACSDDGQPGELLTTKPLDRLGLRRDEPSLDPAVMLTEPHKIPVGLSDYGGSERLVRRAVDLVTVALDPGKRLQRIGVNPVKGILFSGPSGSGKTHLARALCRETKANFYLIDGPEIINKWVGESEQRLRDLFAHAELNGPAILFFDELDSIVGSRGDDAPEYVSRFVGQFLTALDGFESNHGVLVIAATNLPGALDTALLRPGRLSFKLEFRGDPDDNERLAILRASSRSVRGAEHADFHALVAQTAGWTAAELAMIWTEAGVLAALDGREQLNAEDVREGALSARGNREVSLRQRESA